MAHDTADTTQHQPEQHLQTVTVGLVPAPDLAKDIAEHIKDELPEQLSQYVDHHINWKIDLVMDPLTGSTVYSKEILGGTERRKEEMDWDYAICITDLPLFHRKQLIVAEASESRQVAFLSLPSLGGSPMKQRVKESILQLTNEMYHGSSQKSRDSEQKKMRAKKRRTSGKESRQLMRRRISECLSPIKRMTADGPSDEDGVDVRFIVRSRISGGVRLLSGMVRANRPWKVFPEFKRMLAAAFATGTYGLVFPTLWQLSGVYGLPRFFTLMAAAIVSMVVWIILVHGLWEKVKEAEFPYLVKLYNAATITTLTISVFMYYIVLFILFTIAVTLFVPPDLLEDQTGNFVSLVSYVSLAWTATSVGTLVGALGAALESEETVLHATYGYRQRRRYEEGEKDNHLKAQSDE